MLGAAHSFLERKFSRILREPPSVRVATGVIVSATLVVVVVSGFAQTQVSVGLVAVARFAPVPDHLGSHRFLARPRPFRGCRLAARAATLWVS